MDLDNQFELEHLFLSERICRICNVRKNLMEEYYRIRKNSTLSSSYSYECKECTKKRVLSTRKIDCGKWEYPDW